MPGLNLAWAVEETDRSLCMLAMYLMGVLFVEVFEAVGMCFQDAESVLTLRKEL